jgi:O-antigen ligase
MQVVLLGAVVVLGGLVGAGAARAEAVPPLPVAGLLVMAGAAVLLSLTPKVLFLAWFAVAPIFQESASWTAIGHPLWLALYLVPSLVFGIWTLSRRPRWLRPRFLDVLPLAFFLYVLGSVVLAGDTSITLVKAVYETVGIGVVLYYFFAVGPIGSLSWKSIASVVLAVTITEGSMSIIDGLTRWNLWHDTGWQQGESRAVATLANPAALGTLLGMGIVLAVSILVWNGPAQLRTPAIVTLIVGFPGLYFTLTRGPIIGTMVAVILVLMSRTKTRLFAVASLVLAVVVVTASWDRITASTVYRKRVTDTRNIDQRLLLQDWSLKLAEDKPLFGWGFNSFDQAKSATGFAAKDVQQFGGSAASHNTYLTVLVDYGIVGLLLFVSPWLVISWRTLKNVARRPDLRWFMVGALAAFLVYIVANNAGDYKYFSFVPAVPWVLLGLLRRHELTEG